VARWAWTKRHRPRGEHSRPDRARGECQAESRRGRGRIGRTALRGRNPGEGHIAPFPPTGSPSRRGKARPGRAGCRDRHFRRRYDERGIPAYRHGEWLECGRRGGRRSRGGADRGQARARRERVAGRFWLRLKTAGALSCHARRGGRSRSDMRTEQVSLVVQPQALTFPLLAVVGSRWTLRLELRNLGAQTLLVAPSVHAARDTGLGFACAS